VVRGENWWYLKEGEGPQTTVPYITNPGRCGVSGDSSQGNIGRGVGESREAYGFDCRSSERSKKYTGVDKNQCSVGTTRNTHAF
jgi:hypothetical protein